MNLKERAKQFEISLPLMEGREKGELDRIVNAPMTIVDYGFLKDDKQKEYVAFVVKEDPQHFFFGGQVLTDNMKQLDTEGYGEQIKKEGLPVLLGKKKSKEGRTYTTVEFYPEV